MKHTMILCFLLLQLITKADIKNEYQIYFFNEKQELIMEGKVKVFNQKQSEIYEINHGMIVLNQLEEGQYYIQLLKDPYQKQIHHIYYQKNAYNTKKSRNLYYKQPKTIAFDYTMIYFYFSGLLLMGMMMGNIYLYYRLKDHY